MYEVLFIGGPLDHKTKRLRHLLPIYRARKSWFSWFSFATYNLYSFSGLVFYFYAGISSLAALEKLTHQFKGGGASESRKSYLCLGGGLHGVWVIVKNIMENDWFASGHGTYYSYDIRVDGKATWVFICNDTEPKDALRFLYEDYKE